LHIRNYRLFFIGQTVSTTGTWMQRVAQDWLILELGGGPLELSIGLGLQSAPVLLLGMYGGLIADRIDTRKVLLITQSAFAALALALGVLTITGRATIGLVYAMAFGLGCANVIDKPARHSFVVDLVSNEGAANAVSLNSSINNAARLVGPSVAGIVIALTSTGVAFLLNAGTFIAIIVALLMMDASSLQPRETAPPGWGQVLEGLRTSLSRRELRTPLLATLILSTLSQNFRLTLPLMAVTFGRGVGGYGLLMSALGAGALFGALACANLARPSQRLAGTAALLFGILLLLAAAAPAYGVLAVLVIGIGVGSTAFNATSQTLLLLRSDPDKRGRVMALRELFSNGLTPVGTVAVGWVCAAFNPRAGLVVGGAAAIVAAGLMFREGTRSVATRTVLEADRG
jgi:MFS family permease